MKKQYPFRAEPPITLLGVLSSQEGTNLQECTGKLHGMITVENPGGTPCTVHLDAGPGVAGFLARREGELRS